MKFLWSLVILLLLTNGLAACNDRSEQEAQIYRGLESDLSNEIDYSTLQDEQDPLQEETEREEGNEEAAEQDDDDLQRKEIEEEPSSSEEVNQDVHEEIGSLEFSFEEFIDRWNALSDLQYSELYITSLELVEDEVNRSIFRNRFGNGFILTGYLGIEKEIEGLSLQGTARTEDERYDLLTGWSQIILMSNIDFDHYNVNRVFDELKVGPNATISNEVNAVDYQGIVFRLSRNGNDYLFEADFTNETT